jgi:hypothetical protein
MKHILSGIAVSTKHHRRNYIVDLMTQAEIKSKNYITVCELGFLLTLHISVLANQAPLCNYTTHQKLYFRIATAQQPEFLASDTSPT